MIFILIKTWKIIIKTKLTKSIWNSKRYSFKNSDKTQDNETIITQNRYEVFSDSDESNTNWCNNDNGKLKRQAYHHGR